MIKSLIAVSILLLSVTIPAAPESTTETRPSISWDHQSLRQISSPQFRSAGYARMVELHDGSLLCVYEADGSIVTTRSRDKGDTWSEPVFAARGQDGVTMATPDILELHDKSILVGYNPRPYKPAANQRFGIRTIKSNDGGLAWKEDRLLYEASEKFNDGCWEPVAIQLRTGEIQLFFANEAPYTESNDQNISLLRSLDSGLTWTTAPETISYLPGGRDGMPAPLLLANNQEIVCAIEQTGWRGALQPAIIRTTLARNWKGTLGKTDRNREQPLKERLNRDIYAGAPYLRQLSTGQTVLSYQGTEGRKNDLYHAEMKVLLGDENARNFTGKTTPFDIPQDKRALWNSLSVLKDDTIVALTSTNAFSEKTEVWMIKGRVLNSLTNSINP